MQESLALRVAAIFEIMVISACGAILPSYMLQPLEPTAGGTVTAKFTESIVFRATKTFSGGLILSVAFCHLLPDSQSELSDDKFTTYTNQYPMSLALALFGTLTMLVIEEITSVLLQSMISDSSIEMSDFLAPNSSDKDTEPPSSSTSFGGLVIDIENCTVESVPLSAHTTDYIARMQLMKLIIFEFSIALHSVIIGYNLGTLTEEDIGTIEALMIAVAFHQFFEGFSLGTMMAEQENVSFMMRIIFISTFSFTTPIGILIGIFTSDSKNGNYAKGIANGFAAGLLIYAALVEILAHEFRKETSKKVAALHKPIMCLTMLLGAACMSLLAVWA
jgi:zinc transporter 1/2/3